MNNPELELPIEKKLLLEQIKRKVAESEDIEKLKGLLLSEIEDRMTLRHYCDILLEQIQVYESSTKYQ
jgi:hypothetical protein